MIISATPFSPNCVIDRLDEESQCSRRDETIQLKRVRISYNHCYSPVAVIWPLNPRSRFWELSGIRRTCTSLWRLLRDICSNPQKWRRCGFWRERHRKRKRMQLTHHNLVSIFMISETPRPLSEMASNKVQKIRFHPCEPLFDRGRLLGLVFSCSRVVCSCSSTVILKYFKLYINSGLSICTIMKWINL